MHDCRRFREELTGRIIGGTERLDEGLRTELSSCDGCSSFYRDAQTILRIVDSANVQPPELPSAYWTDFSDRLRSDLAGAGQWSLQSEMRNPKRGIFVLVFAAAASVFLAVSLWTLGSLRTSERTIVTDRVAATIQVIDDHIAGLDPGTVDYLGQSELFLRSFTKLHSTDTVDLADARTRAEHQLIELRQRKEAAFQFPPVEGVLDDYEGILRDINNLEQPSAQNIAEIQHRIERNGLIAAMKVYQPRIVITAEP